MKAIFSQYSTVWKMATQISNDYDIHALLEEYNIDASIMYGVIKNFMYMNQKYFWADKWLPWVRYHFCWRAWYCSWTISFTGEAYLPTTNFWKINEISYKNGLNVVQGTVSIGYGTTMIDTLRLWDCNSVSEIMFHK